MLRKWTLVVLCIAAPAMAQADRNVRFTGDFESGKFQPNGGTTDSFFIKTLPDPQVGGEAIRTGSGGGAPSSSWDSKVLRSQDFGGQLIKPRQGQFFARHILYYDKDYRNLNDGVLHKARAEMGITHGSNRIDFDTEVYMGLSIFVPKSFEHETGTKEYMTDTLLVLNTDSSASFLSMQVFVPKGGTEAHWYMYYPVNDSTVREGGGTVYRVDLGPVNADKGKWTDFVIRFRSNPFSVDTNPAREGIANANDKLYRGNKGILQLWKAEGPVDADGNRRMVQKINRVNKPVGNVPGTTNGKSKLAFSVRIYKGNWQRKPTDVKGPIYYGFDEFRFGEKIANGTGYQDVHPAQLACTEGCPGGSAGEPTDPVEPAPEKADPKAPQRLIILD